MKKVFLLLMLFPVMMLLACGKDDEPTKNTDAVQTFTVNGVADQLTR